MFNICFCGKTTPPLGKNFEVLCALRGQLAIAWHGEIDQAITRARSTPHLCIQRAAMEDQAPAPRPGEPTTPLELAYVCWRQLAKTILW